MLNLVGHPMKWLIGLTLWADLIVFQQLMYSKCTPSRSSAEFGRSCSGIVKRSCYDTL